jgi:hypothetical protein
MQQSTVVSRPHLDPKKRPPKTREQQEKRKREEEEEEEEAQEERAQKLGNERRRVRGHRSSNNSVDIMGQQKCIFFKLYILY